MPYNGVSSSLRTIELGSVNSVTLPQNTDIKMSQSVLENINGRVPTEIDLVCPPIGQHLSHFGFAGHPNHMVTEARVYNGRRKSSRLQKHKAKGLFTGHFVTQPEPHGDQGLTMSIARAADYKSIKLRDSLQEIKSVTILYKSICLTQ